ncbi:hypothetical protein J3E69DRAFT_326995 [Trichoderma sp. SZMC 28015]
MQGWRESCVSGLLFFLSFSWFGIGEGCRYFCHNTLFFLPFRMFLSLSPTSKFLFAFYQPCLGRLPSKVTVRAFAVGQIIRTGEGPADPDIGVSFLLVSVSVPSRLLIATLYFSIGEGIFVSLPSSSLLLFFAEPPSPSGNPLSTQSQHVKKKRSIQSVSNSS